MKVLRYLWVFILALPLLSACIGIGQNAHPPVSVSVTDPAPVLVVSQTPLAPVASPTFTPVTPATAAIPTETPTPAPSPTPDMVRFAVIGDYGSGDHNAADVAALVKSWQPDLILTVGDNNYPTGAYETIDQNVGQFYHEFIYPYRGVYGAGASENRFFPTIGNHDMDTDRARPMLDYFELPGNERYYNFTWGPVEFFALDSDSREPDGVGMSSVQAQWFQAQIAGSTQPWQVVFFHHPPYSSGMHGSVDWMRWPFAAWGADVILAGHDHTYERLIVDGIPLLINGLGGGAVYYFESPLPGSQVRFAQDYGAILGIASATSLSFQFITRTGFVVDTIELGK